MNSHPDTALPLAVYCSVKGLDTVRLVQRNDKEQVHELAFSPFRALMNVRWEGGQYWLVADSEGNSVGLAAGATAAAAASALFFLDLTLHYEHFIRRERR